jgi:hypothetical protein
MLGSGLVLYTLDQGLPKVIGQSDFSTYIDLRSKHHIFFMTEKMKPGVALPPVSVPLPIWRKKRNNCLPLRVKKILALDSL